MDQQEAERRMTNKERIRARFLAHPGRWFGAQELEHDGGRQAWRTRVSEVRRDLEHEGLGTIVNRLSRRKGAVTSEYMFRPIPLGRDASERVAQKELF